MATSVKIVGTCVDDSTVGSRVWANPSNATADDTNYATTPDVKNTSMHYLFGTMSGNVFAIPGGSTIDGISVTAVVSQTTANAFTDGLVKLVLAGSAAGDSKGRGPTTYWPTTEDIVQWGAADDKWGNTLTPAIVNATDFGACIQGVEGSGTKSIGSVDYIKITVTYTAGGAAEVANVTDSADASTTPTRSTVATRPTIDSADASTSATRLLAATRPTTDGVEASTTATATKSAPADVSDGADASDYGSARLPGQLYYCRGTTAHVTPFTDWNRVLNDSTGALYAQTLGTIAAYGTHYGGYISAANVPDSTWWESSSMWFIEVRQATNNYTIDCRARLNRLDSGGSVIQTGDWTSAQTLVKDVTKIFSMACPEWDRTEEAAGNLLAVELELYNDSAGEATDYRLFYNKPEIQTGLTEGMEAAYITDDVDASTTETTPKTTSISTTDGAEASTAGTTAKATSISQTDGAEASTAATAITSKAASETSVAEAGTSATANLAALRSDTSGAEASTSATTTKTTSISNTDGVDASTSATTTVSKAASVTDGADASDLATTVKSASAEVSDLAEASTIGTAEAVSEFYASVTDGAGAASTETRQAAFGRSQIDNAGGATAPVRQTDAGRLQEDDAEAADDPDVELMTAQAEASDSAGASDAASRTGVYNRTRYEYQLVTDELTDAHNNHFEIGITENAGAETRSSFFAPEGGPPLQVEAHRTSTDNMGVRDGAFVNHKGGGIPPGPSPGAEAVIPLLASSLGTTTNSTSYVFSGDNAVPVIINGGDMAVGVDYLVMASATLAMGSFAPYEGDIKLVVDRQTSSSVALLRLRNTAINEGSPPPLYRAGHLSGYAIVTGAGNSNSDIEFAWLTRNGSVLAGLYFPRIIAIPLNLITENTDYWVFEKLGDQGGGISTNTWADIGSVTLTDVDAGEYLVMASTEMKTVSGDMVQTRIQIDSVAQKDPFIEQSRDTARHNMISAYARVHTLGAGTHTITLQGGNYLGVYDKHYHRSKIIVIKASLWNQIVDTSDDTPVSTTDSYPNGREFESRTITLASSGYILGLSNMRLWRDGGGGSSGMVLKGTARGSQGLAVNYVHADARNSQTGFYCDSEISGATTLTQNAGYTHGDVDTYTDDRDLIIWELRTAGAAEAGVANVTDGVGASDSVRTDVHQRTHTDNVGATDSTDIQRDMTRPVTDGAGASDIVARTTEAARYVTDDVGADDTPDVTTEGSLSVTDGAGASDIVARTTEAGRSVIDGAGADDTVTGVKGDAVSDYYAVNTDGAGASDSIEIALTLNRAVQDILAVSDKVNKDIDKRIADAVGASDTSTLTLTTVVETTDNAAASDSVSTQFTFDRTVYDNVGASELVNRVGVYSRLNEDDAAAVDSLLAQIGGEGIDSLTVTSTISTEADLVSTIYETGGS